MPVKALTILLIILMFSGTAFAGRPLITDDANTQGKGKYQLQIGGEYSHDDDEGVTVNKKSITVELDYGIKNNIDLIVSSGYQNFQIDNLGNTSSPEGITDTLIEVKWRFHEDKNGLSLAIKPGIIAPTGNYTKGLGGGDVRLGTGEVRYRLYLIGTKEFKHAAFHLNLGYLRNENRYDARENLLHTSLAGEWKITKKFKIVGNIGVDTSPDTDSCIDPVFLLGGFVYSLSDRIDLDLGVKRSLNDPGYNLIFTGGISIKF
ncbi:MAG: transporter [Proteobacteria bacterium]|nr:transporter [Pseudomonadota bacterium]